MYTANKTASKYMKEKWIELKGLIDNSIIIEETYYPILCIHKTTRQNINNE